VSAPITLYASTPWLVGAKRVRRRRRILVVSSVAGLVVAGVRSLRGSGRIGRVARTLTAVARRRLPHRSDVRYPAVAGSVGRAREEVALACQRWHVPELADPARLVVSELVANAVEHAGTPVQMSLRWCAPQLRIEVADQTTAAAAPRADRSERGKGLLLVDACAASWGCRPRRDGKAVWAILVRPGQPAS
jgi:anti-sigma regulatory factor (Ser/Thr protein kinase)